MQRDERKYIPQTVLRKLETIFYVIGKALATEENDFHVSDVFEISDETDADRQRGDRFDTFRGDATNSSTGFNYPSQIRFNYSELGI